MKNIMKKILVLLSIAYLSVCTEVVLANTAVDLLDIQIKLIAGGQVQLILNFSGEAILPTEFSMDDPSKMVFDFSAVKNKLPKTAALQRLSSGVIKDINFVEVENKVRMIVDVAHVVPFKTERDGNNIIVTLESDVKNGVKQPLNKDVENDNDSSISTDEEDNDCCDEPTRLKPSILEVSPITTTDTTRYDIKAIDFRRGDDGVGRLIIELVTDAAPIDFREIDNELILEYQGATIPDKLLRRFDVSDFGTPIKKVVVIKKDNSIMFKIQAEGDYEKAAYQVDKQYIVEVKPMAAQEKEYIKAQKFKFTGERISLNFQNIEVRAVLQLLADFTGLNIIASDSVMGNVTLKLDNVPWDQALDFILKSKGLGKRESGNIILIAPNEEIAAREKLELETIKQAETLVQLQSEQIQINYAKATDIEKMLQSKDNSVLSSKGMISVDDRTNTIFIKDTPNKLAEIEKLIEKLDVPIRQVMIEAQIVQTSDNLTDLFGVALGGSANPKVGKYGVGVGGTLNNARTMADAKFNGGANVTTNPSSYYTAITQINGGAIATNAQTTANNSSNNSSTTNSSSNSSTSSSTSSSSSTNTTDPLQIFNFAQPTAGGSGIGLAIAKLPGGTLLNLELQASESETKTKILARPKLMTLDQQKSSIETGVDIPYSTTSQQGATPTVSFKKAVLKLEVTPQITPNNKVQMLLSVNQDTPNTTYSNSNGPAMNTTSLTTNILVDNGETVVLGGIFQVNHAKAVRRVPFFSDIPFIGRFFRDDAETDDRQEVLIFVTPRVIKQAAIE